MGRSKPRTNKRPPPKPAKVSASAPSQTPATAPLQPSNTNLPYLAPPQAFDLSSFVPPAAAVNPSDPSFPSALHSWSTSTLSRLGNLPKLTPSQLSAIAGAAAGIGEGGTGGAPIDLPASLAALFEAKLTLDREKAKLMRMQKELKGYRDGVAQVQGSVANGKGKEVVIDEDLGECTCGRHG
ncbi:hypothetical protein BCR39DRAFT_504904 [Naematelia encephala]|uniref:Uncharacterized protein n=1 Tax=Naematelia encephala TaxID=71784 RepID=A0A1Y2B8X1_9TREE|nr:hypothetical protein BCR39DRAFT_504904 [Naematelia encephala]